MTISKMKTEQFLTYINLLTVLTIIFFALTVSATAQSTDPFSPTPMTAETVKGRWSGGKRISYYYSFSAGPGVVKVLFNAKPDGHVDEVGGELLDADGHPLTPIENRGDPFRTSTVGDIIYQTGRLFVATYEIKRRQKFIFRFYTTNMEKEDGGSYSIKVSGDGVSFDENKTSTNKTSTNNNAATGITSCLPKSGTLRLVMDDGTVQEINLSRVREAAVKP